MQDAYLNPKICFNKGTLPLKNLAIVQKALLYNDIIGRFILIHKRPIFPFDEKIPLDCFPILLNFLSRDL